MDLDTSTDIVVSSVVQLLLLPLHLNYQLHFPPDDYLKSASAGPLDIVFSILQLFVFLL